MITWDRKLDTSRVSSPSVLQRKWAPFNGFLTHPEDRKQHGLVRSDQNRSLWVISYRAYLARARTTSLREGLSWSLRVGSRTGTRILVSEPFLGLGGQGTSEDDPQALCKLLACPRFR